MGRDLSRAEYHAREVSQSLCFQGFVLTDADLFIRTAEGLNPFVFRASC